MLSKSPNLEYLRSFHMVAECGSISQAVTKNNITRPTLSRHIQLLEGRIRPGFIPAYKERFRAY